MSYIGQPVVKVMHNLNSVFLTCLKLLKVNAEGDLKDFPRVDLRD